MTLVLPSADKPSTAIPRPSLFAITLRTLRTCSLDTCYLIDLSTEEGKTDCFATWLVCLFFSSTATMKWIFCNRRIVPNDFSKNITESLNALTSCVCMMRALSSSILNWRGSSEPVTFTDIRIFVEDRNFCASSASDSNCKKIY